MVDKHEIERYVLILEVTMLLLLPVSVSHSLMCYLGSDVLLTPFLGRDFRVVLRDREWLRLP